MARIEKKVSKGVYQIQDPDGAVKAWRIWWAGVDGKMKSKSLSADLDGFHFHDLRHCFVIRVRRDEIPDHVIMAITGHKTHSTFERYFSGPTEDQLTAAVNSDNSHRTHTGLKAVR